MTRPSKKLQPALSPDDAAQKLAAAVLALENGGGPGEDMYLSQDEWQGLVDLALQVRAGRGA